MDVDGVAPLVVVMGVSGSGKTTVGVALAQRLGVDYGEADQFHPPANIAKMESGHPLDDADRRPWLEAVGRWLSERTGPGAVATCSALKRNYRDILRGAAADTVFLHLDAPREVLEERMEHRRGHFMPPSLLQSQLQTLEPLQPDEAGLVVRSDSPVDDIIGRFLAWWAVGMSRRTPGYRAAHGDHRGRGAAGPTKGAGMTQSTDMVSVLVKDHEEMKEFFRQIEATSDPEERRDLADRLTAEVARHSVAEEMFLYPAARKVLPNGDELIDEELEEHAEAEKLLKQWEGLPGNDPEFMTVYRKIKEGLLHHIDEEEEPKLFPEMRQALSREEQEQLGQRITTAKKLAPTRPHPSAPDEPPMNMVVGVPTGIIDRIRDLMSGRSTD